MKKSLTSPNKYFEELKKLDEDGVEYWTARELMVILQYAKWSNFENVVEKAKTACQKSEQVVEDHFADVGKVIKAGKGAKQNPDDHFEDMLEMVKRG